MKKIQKRYIAIALSVLLVLVGITATTLALTRPEPTVDTSSYEALPVKLTVVIPTVNSTEIIQLTNDYRATKGLAPLVENALLDQSACAKAQHMVDNKYWAHIAPDGTQPWYFFEAAGYNYSRAGENLAYGHWTSKSVVDGWIHSPKHEENLVGIYNDIGVCALINQQYQGGTNTVMVAHYGTLAQ